MNADELKLFFLNAYDDAVLHGEQGVMLSASVIRALRECVGSELFNDLLSKWQNDGKLKWLIDLDTAPCNSYVIEIIDYI
jgi:hypothetical protein